MNNRVEYWRMLRGKYPHASDVVKVTDLIAMHEELEELRERVKAYEMAANGQVTFPRELFQEVDKSTFDEVMEDLFRSQKGNHVSNTN